jgi:O-glycosyl hydrolase
LKHFSIAHDEGYIVPTMREALALNPGMFTLASPWTAPAWMKENNRLDNVGHSGVLEPAMYGVFARYIVKFIEAYQREGIHISAVTPQNEPGNPTGYPGMDLGEAGEAALVRFHLAPALLKARLGTEIFGYDKGWAARGFPFALPVQQPNRGCPSCTGVVTINEATGAVTRTIDYDQLGQLAKFVQPGAVRVATDHFVAYVYPGNNGNIATPGLDDVAFHNPDGTDALLAYNNALTAVSFAIASRGAHAPYVLAPHATATFVWHAGG